MRIVEMYHRKYVICEEFQNDSGYYCFECLKGYLKSSIMDIKEYVNSPRFRSDPKFIEKLEEVKKILQI